MILFGALLTIHVFIAFQGICEYYLIGHHGWAGAMRSIIGRNYSRYGLAATSGKPIRDTGPINDMQKARVHWHHPPGAHLAVGLSFAILGEHEASARLVPVLAALLSFVLLFMIVRRRYGPVAALASVGCFALLPMQVEYGKLINYEPLVTTMVLLAIECLDRMRITGKKGRAEWLLVAVTCLAICAAGFIDWPAFFFTLLFGFDALLRRPRKPWVFLAVGLSSALMLALLLWWLSHEEGIEGFKRIFLWRGGITKKVTYIALFKVTAERLWDYFGLVPLVAGGLWITLSAARLRLDPVVAIFLLGNLFYILVFKQAAKVHNFFIYFITPAVAMAAGVGIVEILSRITQRRIQIAAAVYVCALFLYTDLTTLPITHKRSYSVRPHLQPSRGFPKDGRLDQIIVARFINEITDEDDLVIFHRTIHPTVQMYYYIDRPHAGSRSNRPPAGTRLFVAAQRTFHEKARDELSAEYALYRIFGYLIFDMEEKGPAIRTVRFEEHPFTFTHWYFKSSFYPPHEIRWKHEGG